MDEDFTAHFTLQPRTGFGGNIEEEGRQITGMFTFHWPRVYVQWNSSYRFVLLPGFQQIYLEGFGDRWGLLIIIIYYCFI